LNDKEGAYNLFLNGIQEGKELREKILIENIVTTNNPYEDFNSFLGACQNS
jgi:hypothetical protein